MGFLSFQYALVSCLFIPRRQQCHLDIDLGSIYAQCEVCRTTVSARCCCFVFFSSNIFFKFLAKYHTSFGFHDNSDNVCDMFCRSSSFFPTVYPHASNCSMMHWILARGVVPVVTSQALDPVSFLCAVIFHTTPSFRGF